MDLKTQIEFGHSLIHIFNCITSSLYGFMVVLMIYGEIYEIEKRFTISENIYILLFVGLFYGVFRWLMWLHMKEDIKILERLNSP